MLRGVKMEKAVEYDFESVVKLAHGVRLREEYFGGLLYDTRNGNIIEVDKKAFQFLRLIKDNPLKVSDALTFLLQKGIKLKFDQSITETLQKLFELKFIEKISDMPVSSVFIDPVSNGIRQKSWLSAPETVHWAITYRCDKNCPDCYTQRFSFIKDELDTNESLKLVDKIADWGVFQLSIGGGEPLMRKDLPQIVSHANNRGLSVNVTTGKLDIEHHVLESLSSVIKTLQLGINSYDLIGQRSVDSIQRIQNLFIVLQRLTINSGVNLFLNKLAVEHLERIIKILQNIGFTRLVLLRYKPPENIERWISENPEIYQMKKLHEKIDKILKENPEINIRVDCALSFLQRNLSKESAEKVGIKGCVAVDRILAIAPDGSVYPCSQLVHPDCYAGNLSESNPELIWSSHILRKYRSFRTKKSFTHSRCGVCSAKYQCGGCRVFASDRLEHDQGCPEPLLLSLTNLGKVGRGLDLAEYLEEYGTITVGEYMKRYGVGQLKAVKELKSSPHCISMAEKNSRKKIGVYRRAEEDIILDIQESIGTTSGGVSFASYEEVSEWIESPSYSKNYPEWIKENNFGG